MILENNSEKKTRVRLFFRKARSSHFSIEGLFNTVLRNLPESIEADKWKCPFLSEGFFPRLRSALAARKAQVEVNHITGDVHFLVLAMNSRRTVLTIHDAAVLNRLSGPSLWIYRFFWFSWPMRRAAVITVISEATRRHLSRAFGLPEERFRVIPNCVDERFKYTPKTFPTSRPRLLQIGTKKNKNLERVAEALIGIDCELRIIGNLTKLQIQALKKSGVTYSTTSNLSFEDLVHEYISSDLLVFVSTIEGFGMPIIEAQSVGRPVITSNCSSMPEVAGFGAHLVDPLDVDSIRSGVVKVCSDAIYRKQLIESGLDNIIKYSTNAVAAQYEKVYVEVGNAASRTKGQK